MTEPVLLPNEHNLIWIDLEMTGLSPTTDRIIEIAVVVDRRANHAAHRRPGAGGEAKRCRARRHGCVEQGHARAQRADRPGQGLHRRRGRGRVEVIAFLKQYVAGRQEPDVRQQHLPGPPFPAKDMPALRPSSTTRNLDVSTLKELARRWKPGRARRLQEGTGAHRASRHPRVHRRAAALPPAPPAALNGPVRTRSSGYNAKLGLKLKPSVHPVDLVVSSAASKLRGRT